MSSGLPSVMPIASDWSLSISFKAPHAQDGVPPYFLNDPQYDDLHRARKIPPFPHMNGEYFLTLEDGQEIKLSRSYRDRVDQLLQRRP